MSQQRLESPSTSNLARDTTLSASPIPADEIAERVEETHVSSPGRDAFRRFIQNWMAVICFIFFFGCVLAAIFAPFLRTSNPIHPNFFNMDAYPSWHHWMGTDGAGQDLYSRLLYGMRVPFLTGFIGTIITLAIGVLLGILAGYFPGVIDSLISRFTDIMFAFPGFLLALIVISVFGGSKNSGTSLGGAGRVLLLTMVFGLVGWPGLMRFVKSLVLGLKEQQFIEAARTAGSSTWSIIYRHLLPNIWGVLLVQASFLVIGFIGTESALSLFGLGVVYPNPDLGVMIFDGKDALGYRPLEIVFPATTLGLLILTGTFVGDGLRDAVDPRANK